MKKVWAVICAVAVLGCAGTGAYAYRYNQNIKRGQLEAQNIQNLAHAQQDGTATAENDKDAINALESSEAAADTAAAENTANAAADAAEPAVTNAAAGAADEADTNAAAEAAAAAEVTNATGTADEADTNAAAEAADAAETTDPSTVITTVVHAAEADDTETPDADVPEEQQLPLVEIPIDFKSLQEINEDIYAWITVPGTKVDYPVLQDPKDDGFYIDHDIKKQSLFAGCIYTEMRNEKDFSDFNTVLYGHNMKDGSMFASLHQFRDRKFFDEHREILVYTPEHIYHYTIFAAYKYDNRHILNTWNFEQKEEEDEEKRLEKQENQKKLYLREIYDTRAMDAFILDEPEVTTEDKIITLSTCINDKSYRYLVQGVLTETE